MKRIVLFSLLAVGAVFQFCTSTKKTQASMPAVTFASNVQPVIQGSCSPCHIAGQGRAKALNNYDAAKSNADEIIARINRNPDDKGFMPMRHPKLPDSTITVFARWKAAGFPQ